MRAQPPGYSRDTTEAGGQSTDRLRRRLLAGAVSALAVGRLPAAGDDAGSGAQVTRTGLIVRLWRTGVKPGREADYLRFANDVSLPMFRQQDGFLGVFFANEGHPEAQVVVTLWEDIAAVERLQDSASYQQAVADIVAAGFLTGEQTVEILPAPHGSVSARLSGLLD